MVQRLVLGYYLDTRVNPSNCAIWGDFYSQLGMVTQNKKSSTCVVRACPFILSSVCCIKSSFVLGLRGSVMQCSVTGGVAWLF